MLWKVLHLHWANDILAACFTLRGHDMTWHDMFPYRFHPVLELTPTLTLTYPHPHPYPHPRFSNADVYFQP